MRRSITVAVVLGCLVLGLFGLALTACDSGSEATAQSGGSTVSEPGGNAGTLTITDQAGRQVTIPTEIKSVFCTSPMGSNLLYMLAPDLMAGWNVTPTKLEMEYIPEQYRDYVGLGGWYGKNTTGNVEEIIKRAPDILLSVGYLEQQDIDDAERIQALLNIPVVMVGGTLEESGAAFRYIGKLVGREERAEELAAYCDEVIAEAKANTAKLTDDKKVRVYYAEGNKGLNTEAEGSDHTVVLRMVGGQNVAQVENESAYGMSPVSLEQVLAWDPEVILVASDPKQESVAYEEITTGEQWKTVQAVKNGKVYQIPRGPFDWFDRPVCVAGILGARWLGNLLYPDLYQYDMDAEVRKFYRLFYQVELTDAQMDRLMGRARPAGVAEAPEPSSPTTTLGEAVAVSLDVKGLVQTPGLLSAADLQAMNVTELTAEHPKKGATDYMGVLLSELNAVVGLRSEATTLVMTASDGYAAEVPLADLSSDALIAIMDDGSLSAVMPGMEGKVWVSDLVSLEFK